QARILFLVILAMLMAGSSVWQPDILTQTSVVAAAAQVPPHDFGDAPTTYPTVLADNGARHIHLAPGDTWLGNAGGSTSPACVDGTATEADALVVDGDNDDGLVGWWFNPATGGLSATVRVSTPLVYAPAIPPGPLFLNTLVDLNQDGDWADDGEWVVQNFPLLVPVSNCDVLVTVNLGTVPAAGDPDGFSTWVRFTLTHGFPVIGSDAAPWTGTGEFISGETEDYLLSWGPGFPGGGGGPNPPPFALLALRLSCNPKNAKIVHGAKALVFNLKTTGNIVPNNLKVVTAGCSGCDPNAVWTPAKDFTLSAAPGINVLGLLPANTPSLKSNDEHNCFPPSTCKSKIAVWYANFDPASGTVGAAYSADSCPCTVYHNQPSDLPPGRIKGVVNGPDGQPFPGPKIGVYDPQGIQIAGADTSDPGTFKIKKVPPGDYKVETFIDPFANVRASQPVRVESGGVSRVNLVLPRPGRIMGTGGPPETGFIDVEIVQLDLVGGPRPVFSERTDQTHKYDTGSVLSPGSYLVKGLRLGFKTAERNVTLASGQTVSVDLNLERQTLPPDFSLTLNPAFLVADQGAAVQTSCSVASINGFTGPVSLSCVNAPAGITCGFAPGQVTPPANAATQCALILNIAASVAPGAYAWQVQGSSGSLIRTATVHVTVNQRSEPNSSYRARRP
ncbi:MAG TPA: carboxypeptidase regulatory-like domain-containing protein, partial [Blastocatellia bacterium]|nr:carboxypeptidase regulatory-like domain-containing protein [Blastocatellia bacterium]